MLTRIGLIALVLVLAFGAGVVLRGSGDDRSPGGTGAAPRLEGDGRFRPIRLVRADPGVLRRPAPEPSGEQPAAPAAAAAAVSAPAAAPPAPPARAPEPDPAPTEPPVQPDDGGSDGANDPPTSTFDLDG